MGTEYNPRIVTDGLMVYLDAANTRSYSGSGSTWYDLKGNMNFTLQNSPSFVSNSAGGSISFTTSSSQYASSSNSLSVMTRFTAEVWHYYTGTNTGSAPTIITDLYPGSTSQINVNLGSTTNGAGLKIAYFNGSWNDSATYALTSNNWYHICGTYDGSNLRLYINSVNQVTTANTGTPTANTGGMRLMRRWDNAEYWGGYLSTVKIYNRALSAAEITQNYNSTKKRYGF